MVRSDSLTESTQPLIANGHAIPPASESAIDEHEQPSAQLSFLNASRIVQYLTLSAGISGLLFGFDTGVISSTLVSIGTDLSQRPLTTADKSVVTAITSFAALLSAPWTGFFADRYGRKSVIFVPALLFVVGALLQAVAGEVWVMVLGRALVGVAVGVASGASPLYITELAPAELRGRLVTIQSLFVTGGQVVAYLTGFAFSTLPHGWRWMVGIGAAPALLQLALLAWMPETPRWLLRGGHEVEARKVLMKIYDHLPEPEMKSSVQRVMEVIRAEIAAEQNSYDTRLGAGISELIRVPGNRRALTIACLLQGLQQLSGFNCLMYFSATTFQLVGFHNPIATSLTIALTNFIFTLVAFRWIDIIGRRRILLLSVGLMVIGLLGCSLAFIYIEADVMFAQGPDSTPTSSWAIVLLLSMIFYVAAYAVGLGCVPWQQSELFPLRVRSLGSGIATAVNWSGNAVIGVTFLPMMSAIGPRWTFAMYAIICLIGFDRIYKIYPETAGLEIEDIGELLRDDWNVQRSVEDFQQRKGKAQREDEDEDIGDATETN